MSNRSDRFNRFNRFWAPHHLNHFLSLPNQSLALSQLSLPSPELSLSPSPKFFNPSFPLDSRPRKDQTGVEKLLLHDSLLGEQWIQVIRGERTHPRYFS